MKQDIIKNQSAVGNNLADILERVLDKGIVLTGDIKIQLADIDLLTIKIRLLITSVEKAKEIGIDWWEEDTFLSTQARRNQLEKDNKKLAGRIDSLEKKLQASRPNRRQQK